MPVDNQGKRLVKNTLKILPSKTIVHNRIKKGLLISGETYRRMTGVYVPAIRK